MPSPQTFLKKLENWKPIHLCWLFKRMGWKIPRYFIGNPDDVGDAAIDRNSNNTVGYTYMVDQNPADADGNVTEVQIYVHTQATISVGIFYETGTKQFKCRSAASLGFRAVGYHSITGLSLAVQTGDLIGAYTAGGTIDLSTNIAGSYTVYYYNGNTCSVDNESTYGSAATIAYAFSVYGIISPAAGVANNPTLLILGVG